MSPIWGPVLIVDDDDAVRNSLKFALEMEGLEVRLYEGGFELLADLGRPAVGCLVVDYNMPRMSGIELVNILRDRQRAYPTILIASQVSDELRGRAARAGVRTVLEKPLSDEALVDSIRSALAAPPGVWLGTGT
ncbi:response regulator transcription factor [Microvirga brassicacearum]|uniref:Response regulator n=1 Tax=Microvirga brassicacearum TaxID=2580413 RepID=A0A5N3PAY6_9HYPH|nr:response regulator [Microvirga brassicacearum]KAB0266854.1 response regulator [Microvirga brassicacearum]